MQTDSLSDEEARFDFDTDFDSDSDPDSDNGKERLRTMAWTQRRLTPSRVTPGVR